MIMPVSRRSALQLLGGISSWGVTGLDWERIGLAQFCRHYFSAFARPSQTVSEPMDTVATPNFALERLLTGNQRFVQHRLNHPHQDAVQMQVVAEHQSPFAAILSCADSRVIPEIIFDQGIGDLFVVRVAGNIAVMEEIASEEYAVVALKTPLIVVLGHENCGAVIATLKGKPLPGVISSLIDAIQPAITQAQTHPGDLLTNAIKANVQLQVQRLKNSPVLAQAMGEDKLNIVGAYYELATGVVRFLD